MSDTGSRTLEQCELAEARQDLERERVSHGATLDERNAAETNFAKASRELDGLRAKLEGSTLNNGALTREANALRSQRDAAQTEVAELRKLLLDARAVIAKHLNQSTTWDDERRGILRERDAAQAEVARLTEKLEKAGQQRAALLELEHLVRTDRAVPTQFLMKPLRKLDAIRSTVKAKEPSGGEEPAKPLCTTPGCIYKSGHLGKCFEPGDVVPATAEPAKPASDTTAWNVWARKGGSWWLWST